MEYRLENVNQVQTNPKAGLTFANALRSILRQDPDIILVGEIRDRETGVIAIEAALTGHLVLTTLHTNDAPSTPLRLIEMGIEPFLVTSSVDCVLAQRLARRLCDRCKLPFVPTEVELERRQVGLLPGLDRGPGVLPRRRLPAVRWYRLPRTDGDPRSDADVGRARQPRRCPCLVGGHTPRGDGPGDDGPSQRRARQGRLRTTTLSEVSRVVA